MFTGLERFPFLVLISYLHKNLLGAVPLPRFAWHTPEKNKCLGKAEKGFFRCAMPKGALPLWKPRTRRREAWVLGQAVAALPSSPTPEPEAGVIPQASTNVLHRSHAKTPMNGIS